MTARGPSFKPEASDPNSIALWYDSLRIGRFCGNPPLMQWMGPEMWLHHRDSGFPFGYSRANGEVITPGTFSTDGGTIPSVVQSLPQMDAWYYGAAYVPHDWIWHLHKMGQPTYSFEESNLILCEAVKTLQIRGFLGHQTFEGGAAITYNIWRGVSSHWARKKWDGHTLRRALTD